MDKVFLKGFRSLRANDYMTIEMRNSELRYANNDFNLGMVIKIDLKDKKDIYLFVHTRSAKSRAEIIYILQKLLINWIIYIFIFK